MTEKIKGIRPLSKLHPLFRGKIGGIAPFLTPQLGNKKLLTFYFPRFTSPIKTLLKNHGLAIIIALLIGLVVILPQIFLIYDLEDEYKGISMAGSDGEEYYSMRVQEVYDGHYKISSPELYEYKNKPYVQPPFPEIAMAISGKILGLSARQIITLAKFILPFFFYLVLYFLILSTTKNKMLSLTGPVIIILATYFIFRPKEIFYLLTFQFEKIKGFIDYYRPVNPQFSSLIFFTWLLIFYHWLKKQKTVLYLGAIITLGLMFYTYPYSWMLAYSIIGFLILFSFNRKTNLKPLTKKLVLVLVLSFIISLLYWLNFYQTINDPLYDMLKKWNAFFKSHLPIWSNLLFLDFIIFVLLFWKKEKNINFYFFFSVFLALGFVINQQIVTGIKFHPGHWHWYYTTPFSILLLLWVFYSLIKKNKKLIIITSIILLIIGFSNGVIRQYNDYQSKKEEAISLQKYKSVYDWFNSNTDKDDVVLADDKLSANFPVYTHNNVYLSQYAELFFTPPERFENKFLTRLYLQEVNKENIDQYVNIQNRDVFVILLGFLRQKAGQCGRSQECFSQEELNGLKEKYFELRDNGDFEQLLKKYRLDYAVQDTKDDNHWDLDQYDFMEFITEINNVKIYKIM